MALFLPAFTLIVPTRRTARLLAPVLLSAIVLAAGACGSRKKSDAPASSGESLSIYIWEDFIPAAVLRKFEAETNIAVRPEYFVSLDLLIDRVRSDPARFDVISPTSYVVKQLADEHLLAPIGAPGAGLNERLEEICRKPWYDPELHYCAPFQWSISGLAYNKRRIPNPPSRWADLFDPKRAAQWAGRMTLLDDARETLGIALLASGKNVASVEKADLERAAALVRGVRFAVARFDSEHFADGLANGSIWIAHGWNGDLARAQARNPDIQYVIPEEGAVMAVDNLAIPAGSAHKQAAERFISFMLRPEVARQVTAGQGFPSCVAEANKIKATGELPAATVFGRPPLEKTFRLPAAAVASPERDRLWKAIKATSVLRRDR